MKFITFSKPFKEYSSEKITTMVEIDLSNLIDYHDYHDAPSSVQTWVSKEELQELVNRITKIINQM